MIKLANILEHVEDPRLKQKLSIFGPEQVVMTTKQVLAFTHHKTMSHQLTKKLNLKNGVDYFVIKREQAPGFFDLIDARHAPWSAIYLKKGIAKIIAGSNIKESKEFTQMAVEKLFSSIDTHPENSPIKNRFNNFVNKFFNNNEN